MKKVTALGILGLIERLPESEHHIYKYPYAGGINFDYNVTNEFLVGSFAGRGFSGTSYEDAANQLIDYLYEHLNHNSMVGKIVTESGFPDLNKVYNYCIDKINIEKD